MAVCLQSFKSRTVINGRFPFPIISARPGGKLWVAYCGYPWFMCTQPFDAELPRTCFLHRCCFFAESDEFQRLQKLENCQQRACGSEKEKAAAGSTSPRGAPAVTSTSGRESSRKNGISAHQLAPMWRSSRAMAEMFGDEEGTQSFKGLSIKTMGAVYKRCFTKKRTQIARNSSPPLLP